MNVRVLYRGVPIGVTRLSSASGLAHGRLIAGPGYEIARERVEAAGRLVAPRGLEERRYWPHACGDFAEAMACELAGDYDVEDARGLTVGAATVVIFAVPGMEEHPFVVVDFRPEWARVPDDLPEPCDDCGAERRSAA